MQNKSLSELQKEVTALVKERKVVKGGTKQEVYEVGFEYPILGGVKVGFKQVKGTCPKNALTNFRKVVGNGWVAKTIVSPTKKRGEIVYEVVNNTYILR